MSEELQAKGMLKRGQKLGRFEYFCIGSTTLNQLSGLGIIPTKNYGRYSIRKPDRLIVDRNGKNSVPVLVVEDKETGKFKNEQDIKDTIEQCNDLCQEIGASIGIATDGDKYFWFNPQQYSLKNSYEDKTTGKKRSYTLITNADGTNFDVPINIDHSGAETDIENFTDGTKKMYNALELILNKISSNNSVIKDDKKIDPLPLAKKVWQEIWVATGKSPEKCLYNVVELFIFKFLSDLNVLRGQYSFDFLHNMYASEEDADVLSHYADRCRKKIRELFPKGEDGTTIINGTIFVNEEGRANLAQSILFKSSIKKFKDFEKEYGKFTNISKEFKSKLYESFLKQNAGLKSLGQYFTPRKVVRAIVSMSDAENLKPGQKLCDPFCGVGGFVLEPINMYSTRTNDFVPKNGEIVPQVEYRGYDKGFEKDEERTIILAKANMLIYLSDIVSKNSSIPEKFAEVFNRVFKLQTKSNLGTLDIIIEDEKDKYDIVLTNPPYVTGGKSSLINEINARTELKKFYRVNAGGVEGLALEWIIRNLKKGGQAFVIVPDGILNRQNDQRLRKFILEECYLNGIVSLPQKTFFATPKKTYILAITRKNERREKQTYPVFTYLVSNIGETLDVNRFETRGKNDLPEMVELYQQYKSIKNSNKIQILLENQSDRCKIQPINLFERSSHWLVDKWWDKKDKVKLGIEQETKTYSIEEFIGIVQGAEKEINSVVTELTSLVKKNSKLGSVADNIKLFPITEIFDVHKGSSKYTKRYFLNHKGNYPVYSSKTVDEGIIANINSYDFETECLTWTTDGIYAGTVFHRNGKFSMTTHCGALVPKQKYKNTIYLPFLCYTLKELFRSNTIGEDNKRITANQVKCLSVKLPVNKFDEPDLDEQQNLMDHISNVESKKNRLSDIKKQIGEIIIEFKENVEFTPVNIGKILDFPETNSKITKNFCRENEGEIPVYASSKNAGSTLGFIKDGLNNIKYYENCLSWNRNGSVGYVFKRDHKFSTNEDHRAMTIKPKYLNRLDKDYLKLEIERNLFLNGFSFLDKCGVEKIKKIKILLPIDQKGLISLSAQRQLAARYNKVNSLKFKLIDRLEFIGKTNLDYS